MLFSMSAINISCYATLSKLVFLKDVMLWQNLRFYISTYIEVRVRNFYKKMDRYQKLFHCYQNILGIEIL